MRYVNAEWLTLIKQQNFSKLASSKIKYFHN